MAHLNLNSIRNKVEDLKFLMSGNVDILAIFETKLDESFPKSQFQIGGFNKPFRYDRNAHCGGTLEFIRDKIPTNGMRHINITNLIECVLTEINVSKTKYILISTYWTPSQYEKFFLMR